MQLAAAADQEPVGRLRLLDAEAKVDLQLTLEPRPELPGRRVNAVPAGQRRGVDTKRHAHCGLLDLDPG